MSTHSNRAGDPGLTFRSVVADAAAEALRLVPAPLVVARRQSSTPSISVSSEKLRNVLISTSRPRTSTLSKVGAAVTVLTRSAATKISTLSSSALPKALLQCLVASDQVTGSPPRRRPEPYRPNNADYEYQHAQRLELESEMVQSHREDAGQGTPATTCRSWVKLRSLPQVAIASQAGSGAIVQMK